MGLPNCASHAEVGECRDYRGRCASAERLKQNRSRSAVGRIQFRLVIQPRPALNYLDVSGPYSSRYILLTCFLSQNENSKVAKLVSDSSTVSERRAWQAIPKRRNCFRRTRRLVRGR